MPDQKEAYFIKAAGFFFFPLSSLRCAVYRLVLEKRTPQQLNGEGNLGFTIQRELKRLKTVQRIILSNSEPRLWVSLASGPQKDLAERAV